MFYVPNFSSSNCVVLRDKDTLRVYDQRPTYNSNINYVDYYINSHYVYNNGVQQFNQYSTLPTCIDVSNITTNVFYRNDIDSILIVFLIILLVCFYFPYRIISRMFGRWFKI